MGLFVFRIPKLNVFFSNFGLGNGDICYVHSSLKLIVQHLFIDESAYMKWEFQLGDFDKITANVNIFYTNCKQQITHCQFDVFICCNC